ncbi:biopolymer transport protein ExbD [Deinobacterium chartae]|uniref:Biopolymer transport protein ExbD n=1 Tax=Deinobacterium chartae TaxID=521158 RepID=A0A841I0V4_9DEIO|nr:biopolymer transporter ExbD [Deinobacterium chartae]MBB6098726.1 biopolymer transport protein ExbD [Deinobacterium chartae]
MRHRFREEQAVTFDFAPMVDIVLLLVIFFMLTSNLNARNSALPIDLPSARSSLRDTAQIPTVSVDRAGKVYLEGKHMTLAQLEAALKTRVSQSGGVVALRADRRGNYGTVVNVMDVIKRAGGGRIAISTRSTSP